jgi:hypothetical protein
VRYRHDDLKPYRHTKVEPIVDAASIHSQETIVSVHRLNSKARDLGCWRIAKKIKPSERGAIKLARTHGSELLCVRYRENADGTERITTVELIVERAVIQKREDPVVAFKLKSEESELRQMVQAKGGRYDGRRHMWKLRRSEVIRLGLRSRIAVTVDQLYQEQEQVHT